ncbi:MAG: DUF2156 domain-containing protein [Oscillospiraceae bacterium]|nr:DUF2156 domain-containing protein [Oscillospiraceae bacterium]
MLNFRSVTLSDKDRIEPYYKKRGCAAAQYTFAAGFIWDAGYPLEVCEDDGYLFVRYVGYSYLCPVGSGDEAAFAAAMAKLEAHCRETGDKLHLHNVPNEEKEMLLRIYGDRLTILDSRDDFEYIYDRQALADLPGKKYHGKKGHVRRFMETDWEYRSLTAAMADDVLSMHSAWCRDNDCKGGELCKERKAVRRALDYFDELGLKGAVLYQGGVPVAYTIGEPTGNSTFAVHFEKAFASVQGAYPAINQMFVQHEMGDFSFVNREEDTGDEGLRKAKLSYKPVRLLELWNMDIAL